MKKTILFALLSLLLLNSCLEVGSDESNNSDLLREKREQEEAARLQKVSSLIILSDSMYAAREFTESIAYLDSALIFAKSESGSIFFKKANYLFERREFEDAGAAFTESGEDGFSRDTSYYLAALCYEKVNKRQYAVDNLRKAIALGHKEANALFERINPERRRVSSYLIRCCDGSVSYSKSRRGTCSHHGGVCNWNEPQYETYRKY